MAAAGREPNLSANPKIEAPSEPTGDIAEPLYFGPGLQLFGWLHRPCVELARDIGIVICNPFGYEAICSHRSVRAFAEAAAKIGVPSLRFDYRGTGDSADMASDVDQIHAWSLDVAAALEELRFRTGVQRICLLGFRIGVLLGALAAHDCREVCGLIAIAPIVSGRRYLKQLRTTRLAGMLGTQQQSVSGTRTENGAVSRLASLEVSGFELSAATVDSLSRVDLNSLARVPAARVFVIDDEVLPTARAWANALGDCGVNVRYEAVPGTTEMLLTAPQFALVPTHMIAAMQEWLESFSVRVLPTVGQPMSEAIGSHINISTASMKLPAFKEGKNDGITERAARLGVDQALFGIVTEPPRDERRRRGVILLNPGVDHHIGASRLYVSLARKWSVRGYVVLRMDLGGIGDSATRPGNRDDEVFPASALDDIRAAIEYLAKHYDVGEISLVGLCSGAYHALRAAAAGIKVHRIMMINPQNYFWKAGMSLSDLQLAEVVRNPSVYRQQVFSVLAWKRLVLGKVNLYRIAQIYFQRLYLTLSSAIRELARFMHIRLQYDLGRELEEIAARDIAIVFVFARGEPGINLLRLEGGSSVTRLGSRCRIHILENGDHVFSHHDSRPALESVLGEELFKRVYMQVV